MSFHENLVLFRKLIGCIDVNNGCCFGFTFRWLEAVFLNQQDIFKKRAQNIQSFALHPEYMLSTLSKIKQKKGRHLNKYEIILLDILAFMDSITLYQHPQYIFSVFTNAKKKSLMNIESISEYAGCDAIQEIGGLTQHFVLTRAYNKAELLKFVTALNDILTHSNISEDTNIGFTFSSHNHMISLTYNSTTYWSLLDINQYPAKHFSSLQLNLLTHYLFKALIHPQTNNIAVFHMSLITPKNLSIHPAFLEKLNDLKEKFAIKYYEAIRRDHQGVNLAFIAAQFNDHESIKEILKLCAPFPKPMALCIAAQNGNLQSLIELSKHHLQNDDVEFNYITTLDLAIQYNHYDCVQYLVSLGVDLNHTYLVFGDPLFTACLFGHEEIVELLIAHQANPLKANILSLKNIRTWINSKNQTIIDKLSSFVPDEASTIALTPKQIAIILEHDSLAKKLIKIETKFESIYQLGLWLDHAIILELPYAKNMLEVLKLTYAYALNAPSNNTTLACKVIYEYLQGQLDHSELELVCSCFETIKELELLVLANIIRYVAEHDEPKQILKQNISS